MRPGTYRQDVVTPVIVVVWVVVRVADEAAVVEEEEEHLKLGLVVGFRVRLCFGGSIKFR